MKFRARYVVVALACAGAIVWMVASLGSNLNYMESVSTAVAQRADDGTAPQRVGGVVKPKSIEKNAEQGAVFVLTDGVKSVKARVRETPPEMFAECTAVVLSQARWDGDTLVGDHVEVRHGATYKSSDAMNDKVGAALDATGCPKTPESDNS